jgi:hypothetical protein
MNGLMHRSNYDVIRRITGPYPRSDLRVLVRLFPGTMANPMIAYCNNRETARRAIFLRIFAADIADRK